MRPMRIWTRWGLAAVAILAVGAAASPTWAACAFPGKTELHFGGTVSLTGVFSDDGKWYKQVYDLWTEQVNARGGILGCPIKMTIYDDKSDAKTVVGLYEKLITVDTVDVLVSPWTSALVYAASPVAEKFEKVLVEGGGCSEVIYSRGNKWIFNTMTATGNGHSLGVFNWIKTLPPDKRPKTVANIYAESVWSIASADAARFFTRDADMRVVVDEAYSMKTTDFTPLVQKIKAANADVVLLHSYFADTVQIVKTMKEFKVNPKLLWSGAGSSHTNFPEVVGDLAEGIVTGSHVEPWMPFKGNKEFSEAFRKKYGKEVYDYPAVGYAALQALEQAITATKSLDQKVLQKYFRTASFDLIMGPTRFTSTGAPSVQTLVEVQWQKGQDGKWKRVIYYPSTDTYGLGIKVKTGEIQYPKRTFN